MTPEAWIALTPPKAATQALFFLLVAASSSAPACRTREGAEDSPTDSPDPEHSEVTSDDTSGVDTHDTDFGCPLYEGPTEIGIDTHACAYPKDPSTGRPPDNAVNLACDDGEWLYDFYTIGVPDFATVEITETSSNAWYESHPVDMWASDPDFYWADFYAALAIVDTVEDVHEGETTLFTCELEPMMTWAIYVAEGGLIRDCVTFGDGSHGLWRLPNQLELRPALRA